MRCPDCNHDFPVKPEVIREKEPCNCGQTEGARIARCIMLAFVALILSALGGCWISNYYTDKAIEYGRGKVESNGMWMPSPVEKKP